MKEILLQGSEWYVKLPGAKTLEHVEVKALTSKTVILSGEHTNFGIDLPDNRYAISDVKWIELVRNPEQSRVEVLTVLVEVAE
jgi:hypothetical protein